MKLIKLTLFISFIFLSNILFAEQSAYMYIEGTSQAIIPGDVLIAGREGSFEVNEIHHLFQKDSAGRVTLHPLIVTTRMSQSMPLLLRAFDTSEVLEPITIRYYRQSPSSGMEENYYTIILRGAKIEMLEPIMLDNTDPNTASVPARFRIRFSYTAIEHQYNSCTLSQAYILTN